MSAHDSAKVIRYGNTLPKWTADTSKISPQNPIIHRANPILQLALDLFADRGAMPVLFISHSSKDDAHANALAAWLRANGFTDFFIDHQQIAGGDKWPEALRASAGSCRVVVCLVTPNWLASLECFNEFGAAWYMGKRIIPLFLLQPSTKLNAEAKTRLDRVCGEDQGVDLKPCVTASGVLGDTSKARPSQRPRNSALNR
jgi:hypothetical protein